VRYIDVTEWSEEDVVKLSSILDAIREFVAQACQLFPQIMATNFETELYSVLEDHLDQHSELVEARGRPMTKQDVAVLRRYFCDVVRIALTGEGDDDDDE
jgi:hypothetical protein